MLVSNLEVYVASDLLGYSLCSRLGLRFIGRKVFSILRELVREVSDEALEKLLKQFLTANHTYSKRLRFILILSIFETEFDGQRIIGFRRLANKFFEPL